MTAFAAAPNCVFLVRENDVGHSGQLGVQREILLDRERLALDRNASDEIHGMNQSRFFGLLPVEPVAETLLGQRVGKAQKGRIVLVGLSAGVATLATNLIAGGHRFGAGLEGGL